MYVKRDPTVYGFSKCVARKEKILEEAHARFWAVASIISLKVHKIEIFFGFEFEICISSLLVMSKY